MKHIEKRDEPEELTIWKGRKVKKDRQPEWKTHPDQPNHPNQAYVLSDAGVQLKEKHKFQSSEEQS